MSAKSVVSEAQWAILLHFMEENRDMARGTMVNDGPMGRLRAAERWGQLAARLNSEGVGTTKTPDKWRDYWNIAKYAARKKACARWQQANQRGGGPLPKKLAQLTDQEERILSLLGRVAVHGEESVRIPFHDLPEPPSTSSTAVAAPAPLSAEWPEPSPLVEVEVEVEVDTTPLPPAPRPWTPAPAQPDVSPPPQPSPSGDSRRRTGTRRVYRRIVQPAPDWVIRLEERRLAADQQMADAAAEIARALSLVASAVQELARNAARGRDHIVD